MSVSVPEFWSLLVASRLVSTSQCAELNVAFSGVKGAAQQGNARTLAEWLIANKAITRYQSTILLAGRPGPFYFGEYRVQERIEDGRLANWFHACHVPTSHPVLLQFLAGPVATDANLWTALVTRATAQTAVVHPLLHRLYEPVDLTAVKMLVWEDLPGQGLGDALVKAGRAPATEVARLGWQTAIALVHLHQLGKVHGDVRPANLWLDGQGFVRVLREAGGPPGAVNLALADPTGQLAARADYLAPEFMQAGKLPDVLTDVYALGCTLFHLAAGQPPFAGGDLARKLARHAAEPIGSLQPFGVSQPLAQVITLLMAKNAQVRFPNMLAVVEQLAPLVDPAWLAAQPPAPPDTLAAYEHWIRQKQVAMAAQAPVAVPAQVLPGTAQGVKPVSVEVAAAKVDVAPSPLLQGANRGEAKAPLVTGDTSSRPLPEVERDGIDPKAAWTYAGIAALLLISLVVALNYGLRSNGTNRNGNEESPAETAQETGKGAAKVTPPEKGKSGEPGSKPGVAEKSGKGSNEPGAEVAQPTAKGPPGGSPAAGKAEPGGATAAPKIVLVSQTEAEWQTLPWASPTAGPPISLAFAPPEAVGYVVLRPKLIAAHAEGSNVMKALEPRLKGALEQLNAAAGIPFAEIEQLIIGIHPHETEAPRYSFVVRTSQPMPAAEMLARWQNPPGTPFSGDGESATLYAVKGFTLQIPAQGGDRVFIMGHEENIQEGVKMRNMPLVSKEMQRLLSQSDSSRMLTILIEPRRLFGDGRKLFSGDRQKLLDPLERFLGDDILAASLSLHVSDHFYWEARLYSTLDRTPQQLAGEFKQRIDSVPRQVLDYAASIDAHPYWKKLYLNFPQMIQYLQRQTRTGVDDKTILVNGVLPVTAASNLMAASELALATSPGAAVVVAGPSAGPKAAANFEEALAVKISYGFPAQSLEFAVAGLAEEATSAAGGFQVSMKILGKDLELEGITRNQSIRDFKAENMSVADVLTALVRRANPDPSVKTANEPGQKLVWVLGPDPDDPAKQMILLTTRAAVEKNKWNLPAPFVLKP